MRFTNFKQIKKILLLALIWSICLLKFATAQFSDIYETYLVLDINGGGNQYYDLMATTGNPDFNNANLGTFYNGNSIIINGAENKIWKCDPPENIDYTTLYYRWYKVGSSPGAFTPHNIFYTTGLGTGPQCGGTSQQQSWNSWGANIGNIFAGLTPGVYYLEVYTLAHWVNGVNSGFHYASNGGSNYLAQFTLSANCANNISISPTSVLPLCQNAPSPTLTATIGTVNGFGPADITYEWYRNTTNSNSGGTLVATQNTTTANGTTSYSPATSSPGTYYYYARVINSHTDPACSGTYTTNPVSVTVLATPTVTISSDLGNTICANQSPTFTATANNAGTNPTYQWKRNGSNVGTNSNTYNPSSVNQGDVVTVEVTPDAATLTCPGTVVTSNSITMTVNPILTPSVTIAESQNNICPGQTVNFTIVTSANTGASPGYLWLLNGSPAPGTNNTNSYASNSLANGDAITLELTSNATCASPSTVTSNTNTITVRPAVPSAPSAPTISTAAPYCPGATGVVIAVPSVANATNYTWNLPTGSTITSGAGTNAITVTLGTTSGTYNIYAAAQNSCGSSAAGSSTSFTISPATPVQPGAIVGPTGPCPVTSQTYTIAAVTNATSYNWSVPSGWTINSGQGTVSISVTTGNTGENGNITVTATNSCGTSTARTLAVTVPSGTPTQPGAISPTANVCQNTSGLTYSVPNVGGTTYSWTVTGAGWSITSGNGTSSIVVTSGTANGTLSVTATNSNGCGIASTASSQIITVQNPVPTAPTSVTSSSTLYCPGSTVTFTANGANYATAYDWIVPGGWVITSSTPYTNSITATVGAFGNNGNVQARAENSCGNSSYASLSVTVNPGTPSVPAAPTTTATICATGTSYAITVTPVPNATEYEWNMPSGAWTIQGSAPYSNTILVNTSGAASGAITVRAKNSCGTSAYSSALNYTIQTTAPGNPSAITGAGAFCGAQTINYTIPAVSGATGYLWTITGSTGGTISAGQNTPSITVNYPANGTLQTGTLSVVALNGCIPSATPSTINLSSGPGQWVSTGGDVNLCSTGASGTFTYAPSGSLTSNPGTIQKRDISFSFTGAGLSVSGNNNSVQPWTPTFTIANNNTADPIVYTLTMTTANTFTCGSYTGALSDQKKLTIYPIPTASISVPATACTGATVTWTITGSKNATVTFTESGVAGNQTIVLSSTGTGTIVRSNVTANKTITLVSVAHTAFSTCTAALAATATVTISPTHTVVPGGPAEVCENSSAATLSGASVSGYTGIQAAWQIVSGGGSLSSTGNTTNPAAVTYAPISGYVGDVVLQLTSVAGVCPSVSSTRTITVNPLSTAVAAGPDIVCQSSSPVPITLTGASVGGGATTGAWSIITGGGSLSTIVQTPAVSAVTYTPATNSTTSVTLRLTTNSLTGCNAAISDRSITINPRVVVNPGGPYTICSNGTVTTSGASITNGTMGTWSGGTGSWSNATTLNGATYTPSAAEISAGTVVLTLTSSDPSGPCDAVSNTVSVTINPFTQITAGADVVICSSSNFASLSGSLMSGPGSTYTWSGGAGSFTAPNSLITSYQPTNIEKSTGSVTLTLTSSDPDGAGPCASSSDQVLVSFNPQVVVDAGSSQTICSNQTATMSGTISGGITTGTWSSSGTGSFANANSNNAVYTPGASDIANGTVTLFYTSDDPAGPCNAISATMTLTIQPSPAITTQPINTTVCNTQSASFTVVATGYGPLTYQWYKGSIGSGVAIGGGTSATLTISNATLADAGSYYVVVTGGSPCTTVTSTVAQLVVDQNIIITTQPVTQTACQNSGVSFSVAGTANGSPITNFQWRKDGSPIAGATGGSYTISNVVLADAGNYDVILYAPAGFTCSNATSAQVALIIDPLSIGGTAAGAATVCSGVNSGNITVSGYTGSVVRWESSTDNFATTPSSTITNAASIPYSNLTQTTYYRAVVKNGVCAEANSSVVTVTVRPVLTATISGTTTVCLNGGSPLITFTGANGSAPYTFTYNLNGGNTQNVTTSSGSSVTIPVPTATAGPFTYNLLSVTDANSCTFTQSGSATVTVQALPTASIAGSTTVCIGSSSPNITFMGAGGTAPYTFTYTVNGGTNQFITTSSGNSVSVPVPTGTAGTFTYSLISVQEGGALACSQTQTGTASILVQPDATIVLSSAPATTSQNLCSGTAPGLTPITYNIGGSGTGATIAWLPAIPSGINANFAGGTFTITGIPTNVTASPITYTYTVTTIGPCGNPALSGSVTVTPGPIGGIATASYSGAQCANAASGSISWSGGLGTLSDWEFSTNGGTNWSSVGSNANPLSYNNLSATRIYRALVSNGVCTSPAYSSVALVQVIPANFTASPINYSPDPPAICYPGTATITATGTSLPSTSFSGGMFDNGNPPGWCVDGVCSGSYLPANGDNQDTGPWRETNDHSFSDGDPGNTNYGGTGGKFAIANGAYTSIMTTPVFGTQGLSNGAFTFYTQYQLKAGSAIYVEISTNGGTSYQAIPLWSRTAITNTGPNYDDMPTDPNGFVTIDLTNYLGLSNLKVRFRYVGSAGSAWTVDGVTTATTNLPTGYTWATSANINTTSGTTVVFTAPPNNTNSPVVYNYTVTPTVAGCSGSPTPVSITVNPVLVTTSTVPSPSVCSGTLVNPLASWNSPTAGTTTFTWTRDKAVEVTGIPNSGSGTSVSGTPINTTTTPQTVTFTVTPANSAACNPTPFTVQITVNPNITAALSGGSMYCNTPLPATTPLTINSVGPFPFDIVLNNGGGTHTIVGSPQAINVPTPAVTTTYSIVAFGGGYTSCAATPFSGNATITISAAIGQPIGTWTCTAGDGDWFNPCNWGGGVVPIQTTQVIIPTGTCNAIIDPTTAFALSFASIQGQVTPTALSNNVTINGSSVQMINAALWNVSGNWSNNVGVPGFVAGNGTVSMVGSNQQTLSTVGAAESFNNLIIANTSSTDITGDAVVLNSIVQISDVLTLTDGVLKTDASPGVYVYAANTNPNAVTGGSVASYINGPIRWNTTANQSYNVPLGEPNAPYGSNYHPASMATSGAGVYEFDYEVGVAPMLPATFGGSLLGVENTQYWRIIPVGSCGGDIRVAMQYTTPGSLADWEPTPASIPPGMAVGVVKSFSSASNNWYFTDYPNNIGGGFSTTIPETLGFNVSGTVWSQAVACTDQPTNANYTFGYSYDYILFSGLPVKLLEFNARAVQQDVHLLWKIASATDLREFVVYHSTDGKNFNEISTILSNGNLYNYKHSQVGAGLHYYRLLIREKDGKRYFSKTIVVNIMGKPTLITAVRVALVNTNVVLQIESASNQSVKLRLFDLSGRVIWEKKSPVSMGKQKLTYDLNTIPAGMLILEAVAEDGARAVIKVLKN